MAAYFSPERVAELAQARDQVHKKFVDLRNRYLSREYQHQRAHEYAQHGFCRRLGTLDRAIDLVFEALPPEREDIPERHEVVDATIAVQSFLFNVFGCLDNLAWIWVMERDVRQRDGLLLQPRQISLTRREVNRSLSKECRDLLRNCETWFKNLKDLRDALAHRIPLYIPPCIVTPDNVKSYVCLEQNAIEASLQGDFEEFDRVQLEQRNHVLFRPLMTHSLDEDAPMVVFHAQMLQDFVTIDAFGRRMLEDLER